MWKITENSSIQIKYIDKNNIIVYNKHNMVMQRRWDTKIAKRFGKVVTSVEITDIRVKKVSGDGKMKAIVSVTFDNAFVVHDIKVIEGQDKLFTAMPSRRTPDNEFKDIAHPINSEMRETLEKAIITKYNETISEEE